MILESCALGLDNPQTLWTAIGAISTAFAATVALVLGLWGIVGPIFRKWKNRPKLELQFSHLADHSELLNDVYHLRVPVKNADHKDPATAVEVSLLSISEEHVPRPIRLPLYCPIRLVWAHGGQAVTDRISGGTVRLLDLGQLTFAINAATGFAEAISARIDQANPVLLGFNLEVVPTAGRIGLPVGSYRLKFLISSSEATVHQSAVFTVRNRHLADGSRLGDYLHIE